MPDESLQRVLAAVPGPVLVVGASGFVGANLLRALLAVRDDAVGTRLRGPAWRLEGIAATNLAYLDVVDLENLREVLDHFLPKTIFYCAAYGAYPFETDAERIHQTNYLALTRLLPELEKRGIHAFVHAGSSSEYGMRSDRPREDDLRLPNSDYAVSKSAAADLIAYYGVVRALPACNLRLYSVYGAWEDSSRLIPAVCMASDQKRLPDFVDPDISRDYVYIDDVILAFALAALRMGPEVAGKSFNIGTGKRTTIRDVAQTARALFGIEEEPCFGVMPARKWDLRDWAANPERAAAVLGWKATTDFARGLAQTAVWWHERLQSHSRDEMSAKTAPRGRKASVSAIIACYKDDQAIPVMHRRLTETFQNLKVEYEIIFVNDCSPDNTAEIIRAISETDPHVIGISHARNFGSQAAFRSGMEIAASECCVLLDGDLQDPPELIAEFVTLWREGYDVVFGRRVRREMPKHREFFYRGFYLILDKLSEFPIPRDAGDFSLMDRRVVSWLLRFPERDSFLRGLRAYVGFRQTGVDYVRPERMFGTSTNNFWQNIAWAKKAIFSFSNAPLNWLTVIGIGLFLLTLAAMIGVLIWKLAFPASAPPGVVTVLLGVMLFGSLNLGAVAVIGEYIGKIIKEVKGRPPFIRTAIIKGGRITAPRIQRDGGDT